MPLRETRNGAGETPALLPFAPLRLRVSALSRQGGNSLGTVGIIRDAEDYPADGAFQSVCSNLRAINLETPSKIGEFTSGAKRTGIFILPDCENRGMLETLCWSILASDPLFKDEVACVKAHFECLGRSKVQTQNTTKALVWTLLAGRGGVDPLVGRAAQKGIWNWESPALTRLTDFLKAL